MLISEIIAQARGTLLENTADFWSDEELLVHVNAGIHDLWRTFADTYQDYFFAVDETVTWAANATQLANLPENIAKVQGIEALVRESYPQLNFFPRPYSHPDAANARAISAQDPNQAGPVYYSITGKGAPGGAPVIYVAPKVSSAVALRLIYTPTTPVIAIGDIESTDNPCPGETDQALINFTIAYALAKEREDRKPDPDFLALYNTEKTNATVFVTPRQEDEPEVVEAFFEQLWPN